jgi:isopenicillin N synthase-like dioxygenase
MALKNQDKVPELSLSAYTEGEPKDRQEFIDQLFIGLKKYGFIILKDHPIA